MTSIRKVMKRICCFSVSNAEGKLISSVIEAQTNLHGRNELNGLAGWRNDLCFLGADQLPHCAALASHHQELNLQTVKSSGGYLACYCSCRHALFDKGKMCTGYLLNDRHQQHRSEKG